MKDDSHLPPKKERKGNHSSYQIKVFMHRELEASRKEGKCSQTS